MPTFSTDAELRSYASAALQVAVDHALNSIEDEHRVYLTGTVYGGYSPSVYGRTGDFLEAWKTTKQGLGGIAQGSYEYDSSKIVPAAPWTHYSSIYNSAMTDGLADILFLGNSSKLWGGGGWCAPRNSFQELETFLKSGGFQQFFEAGMTSAGIPWVRG